MNQDVTRKLFKCHLLSSLYSTFSHLHHQYCINFTLFESSRLDNQSFVNHIVWLNQ